MPVNKSKKQTFLIILLAVCALEIYAKTPAEWKTRTIYQVITDRFASTQVDTSSTQCQDLSKYCGGNYQGLIDKLDYIEDLGFNAVWISPMPTNKGDDYHGYAFIDLYTPNPHFGTEADLSAFIDAAHARDVWVMLDVVGNHVAPVDEAYESVVPFNESVYYHYKCQIEDWDDQFEVENCRLANLPDLDQNNEFVRRTLLEWIGGLADKYDIDGFRVDTIPEVSGDFWAEWNAAAGVYCVGEVFNGDIDYVSNYQNYLDGVLSYPLYYAMNDAFAYQKDMSSLDSLLGPSGTYWSAFRDTSVLGTFIDNHDNPRFLYYQPSWALLKNALVMTLFNTGIPIIYYGTEQGFNGGADPANRESLWPNYNQGHELYTYIQSCITIRNTLRVFEEDGQVQRYASSDFYAFSRGDTLVCVTNTAQSTVTYTLSYIPYTVGQTVCNVLNTTASECMVVGPEGLTVVLRDGLPKVYTSKTSSINHAA